MNRTDITRDVADELGLTYTDVDRVAVALFEHITASLARGEDVAIRRFGKFTAKGRRPKVLSHPTTHERIMVPAQVTVGLRASETLKRSLNGSKRGPSSFERPDDEW